MSPSPSDWFRDVVIYQLHVRSFSDSNGDGTGDFDGLTSRLDYIVDLGIDAIWLLPFFPSPLRDDGYDIADYTTINSAYGDMASFKRFLRAAHDRDLRVIVELVMNHTSDQHPWFQRARRSPPGSRYRDFYVWSDTTDKYTDARIIFTDTETSNWTFDPVAQAYYWHRFYSHQPDLNFDSPDVRREMFRIFDRWFKIGIDGVRLDAIPYLFEREGTSCESLPETHAFLKSLRAHLDEHYPECMLLAEANQWPEDAVEYFGDGDECHMAFHFPVMPRLFLAVQMESRAPIVDILEQTPAIPEHCQWVLFLRNHDELTLEMVTDEERDYMYRRYAQDPRMRVNIGIRRRLAALLQNDRRKIELLNTLLLSLPGTPTIYYGDELGMGDNVYLGDRDSVRTPMQWNDGRNAGFSDADPQRLFLPVITSSQHHYESVNVEAQRRNTSSLWWWMRRMIVLRQRNPVFARGDMKIVDSDNRKVLTFLRTMPGHYDVLVVANLSRHAQVVNVHLTDYPDVRPVELAGGAVLGPITDDRCCVTLGPHDIFWLRLTDPFEEVAADDRKQPAIAIRRPLSLPLDRRGASELVAAAQPFVTQQRWFVDRGRAITEMSVIDAVHVDGVHANGGRTSGRSESGLDWVLTQVDFDNGEPAQYALVLGPDGDGDEGITTPATDVAGPLTRMILRRQREEGTGGTLVGRSRHRWSPNAIGALDARPMDAEQSHSLYIVDDQWVLKVLRRLEAGVHPEVEIVSHLNDVGFPNAPQFVGTIDYQPRGGGEATTIATLRDHVRSDGTGLATLVQQGTQFLEWAVALLDIDPREVATPRLVGEAVVPEWLMYGLGEVLTFSELLGIRTAELHLALAEGTGPRLAPAAFDTHAKRSMYQAIRTDANETVQLLLDDATRGAIDPAVVRDVARRLLARCEELVRAQIDGMRIRVHGDLHLSQILVRAGDITFIDFEGQSRRPMGERAIKRTPLVDVASMVRSFDYAAEAALRSTVERGAGSLRALDPWARIFEHWVAHRFVESYVGAMRGSEILPSDPANISLLLDAAIIQRAGFEVRNEMGFSSHRVPIPLRALADIVESFPTT